MSILEFLLLLLLAGIAGGIGRALVGSIRGGVLVSIGVGFIGALLGSWLARLLSLPVILAIDVGPSGFPLVWAILGATIFVAILSLVGRPKTT
jgi:uncharacterized membrane protein YeaQ/YmgE (transglycosylase-associated protein family)